MGNDRFYDSETLRRLQLTELDILKDFASVCQKHGLPYFGVYGTVLGAVRHGGFIPWDDDIDVGMLRTDYERFLEIAEQELGDRYDILKVGSPEGYVMQLSKICKKNTTFIEATDTNRTYRSGIFMDVFPFDEIPRDPKLRKKQYRSTWIWGRACVLTQYGDPKLPELSPVLRKVAAAGCKVVHRLFKLFHFTLEKADRHYRKAAMRYLGTGTGCYTEFTYFDPDRSIIYESEITPLQDVAFEDTRINVPNDCSAYLTREYGDYMKLPAPEEQHNHYPAVLDFEQ